MQSQIKHIRKFSFLSAFIWRYLYYNTSEGDEPQIVIVYSEEKV